MPDVGAPVNVSSAANGRKPWMSLNLSRAWRDDILSSPAKRGEYPMLTARLFTAAALAAIVLSPVGDAHADQTPPKPDEGTTVQEKCIVQTSDFKMSGKNPAFMVALENQCEQRMSCRVDVNVSSAKGSALGHATLVLAPKSAGPAAKKTYTLKVKLMGGMAQTSRACKVL
jgi:hypothetical protein